MTDMTEKRTAIILAGGRGSRMGYVDKALIEFRGRPLLAHVLTSISGLVDEVIISVRDGGQKASIVLAMEPFVDLGVDVTPVRIVYDKYHDAGPLAGIHAGISAAPCGYSFICACDMPFICGDVVDMLFRRAAGHDAAIARWENGRQEPLHAVYRKGELVKRIEESIRDGDNTILAPVRKLDDVQYVDMGDIRHVDANLRTFVNLNTLDDIVAVGDVGKVESEPETIE